MPNGAYMHSAAGIRKVAEAAFRRHFDIVNAVKGVHAYSRGSNVQAERKLFEAKLMAQS